ncbi:LytR/AlgR family response regulator transcription factor [Zunongwangia sp. H14]|uniref:LytR/AlgR family response regulator transcription factor n=1 Tax=Zunongwangia sp. H14 TaxID=3240792 RepID=UPI003565B284
MKQKLTCYIIDDEPLAQEILEEYISKVSFLELKGVFNNPLEASQKLDAEKPDLLFLDINMPDLNGLQFIPLLNYQPKVILTTAYDQYALKAYDLHVQDYLLKPFSFERFYKGVTRLYNEEKKSETSAEIIRDSAALDEVDHIFLKTGNRIQKLSVQEILFVEGMKDYLRVHTTKEKIMTLMSFAKMEELLPASKFARVHRSYLVAVNKINHIEKKRIWIGEKIIPISSSHKENFFKKLKGI